MKDQHFKTETLDDIALGCTLDREPFFEIARKYCRANAQVLDIGAGEGGFARSLANCDVHLLDGNPETVEMLQREFKNVYLHRLPSPFPFSDQFFDVIHCSHLVEHLQPSELYEMLLEVDRCLRAGGVFVVSTPLMWEGFYDDLSHVRPYTPKVFKHYLASSVSNRTRRIISHSYEVVELRYRYTKTPIPFHDVSYSNTWAKRSLFRIIKWLNNLNVSSYERNGYTLVLKKRP